MVRKWVEEDRTACAHIEDVRWEREGVGSGVKGDVSICFFLFFEASLAAFLGAFIQIFGS